MNPTKTAAAFALALALCPAPPAAAARGGQKTDARKEASAAPARGFARARQARPEAPPDRGAFEFELKEFSYHVASNGNGRRTKGGRARRFNLRLDGREYVEGLRFALYEGDLLLVCELADGDGDGGLVALLEQPSMRALWRQKIPASGVGEPLRDGHSLYVTGVGFVGKIDMRTGAFDWQHDLLDDEREGGPMSFGSFGTPELAGEEVLFGGSPVYNQRRTLVVNRKTGKIIRVE